ncbi:hypothetical protein [Arthrobacter sp. MMS18-M83]|uniref:hypothetical protein n=1 Tax=Arthrobacter sp. MMS18-M83 TaxID=2996261 RepID=UPI00227AB395|nr:hypothetical protein [Arthrobacter sp. MMS18-M83]WAH99286.1 hypothetical protein OW521_10960 [Arthrobacter sp. MMS18-M83]
MLYDATRRPILSQSAHMDLGFGFDLKAPEYEAGRVSYHGRDDKATSGYKIGDRLPPEELGNADCLATHNNIGFIAVLHVRPGPGGQQVAVSDELTVVDVRD